MPFVQRLWLDVSVEKIRLSHLQNTSNGCHGNQSVSCDEARDKLSEKLNSRLLGQEEHDFQKGAQCAPFGNPCSSCTNSLLLSFSEIRLSKA